MMENLLRDEPVSDSSASPSPATTATSTPPARRCCAGGARGPARARARRDRPRARLRHVALAGPRRGPRRRAGGRARDAAGHVPLMPARLVTIPISHYCEKARWALDRAGSPTARSATCRSSTGSPRAGRAAAAPSPCWCAARACSPSRPTSSPTPTATRGRARLFPEEPGCGPRSIALRARLRRRPRPRGPALGLLPHARPARPRARLQLHRACPRGSGAPSR